MRVSSIKLQNFRGFAACTLSLDRPLTVLVGVNGAGKTSTLDAIVRLLGVTNRVPGSAKRLLVDADIRRDAAGCEIDMVGVTNGAPFHTEIQLVRGGRQVVTTTLPKRAGAGEADADSGERLPTALPAAYYPASRMLPDQRYLRVHGAPSSLFEGGLDAIESLDRLSLRANLSFDNFFQWFRLREDLENEQRTRGAPEYEDRPLKAVRDAMERVVPGISRLQVQRLPFRLVALKNGAEYELDQLSDGERGLLAMVGDLAFRLSIAHRELPDPLQGAALVLIDEIEQHLHPSWQRLVVKSLLQAFPNCQFIVTTHSPQVLSEVPNDAVLLLDDFQFFRPAAPTQGRDTNSILLEVLGVAARPQAFVKELDEITGLLDDGRHDEARDRLDRLAQSLTERDPEVARLRGLLDLVERIDASDREGA
ncbi:AAA family ATPase [Sorangium sp. So ce1014]|uniref:AAA family ATPase n=1 Tax=Sorangium sp. So ce1014 TaxID=3133326 RepID=UPI003F5F2D3D